MGQSGTKQRSNGDLSAGERGSRKINCSSLDEHEKCSLESIKSSNLDHFDASDTAFNIDERVVYRADNDHSVSKAESVLWHTKLPGNNGDNKNRQRQRLQQRPLRVSGSSAATLESITECDRSEVSEEPGEQLGGASLIVAHHRASTKKKPSQLGSGVNDSNDEKGQAIRHQRKQQPQKQIATNDYPGHHQRYHSASAYNTSTLAKVNCCNQQSKHRARHANVAKGVIKQNNSTSLQPATCAKWPHSGSFNVDCPQIESGFTTNRHSQNELNDIKPPNLIINGCQQRTSSILVPVQTRRITKTADKSLCLACESHHCACLCRRGKTDSGRPHVLLADCEPELCLAANNHTADSSLLLKNNVTSVSVPKDRVNSATNYTKKAFETNGCCNIEADGRLFICPMINTATASVTANDNDDDDDDDHNNNSNYTDEVNSIRNCRLTWHHALVPKTLCCDGKGLSTIGRVDGCDCAPRSTMTPLASTEQLVEPPSNPVSSRHPSSGESQSDQNNSGADSNIAFHPANVFDFSEKFLEQLKLDNYKKDSSTCESSDKSDLYSLKREREQKSAKHFKHLNWNEITTRYGKMPRRQLNSSKLESTTRSSYCGRFFLAGLCHFFPVLVTFKNYSLPKDLFFDLMAGFTIAILHIPQGMAYGLLAGVDPINGLYTSLVPVLIMALMSKSRHVSYGTFAVVSMLMANTIADVRLSLNQEAIVSSIIDNGLKPALVTDELINTQSAGQISGSPPSPISSPLVITNNHQPAGRSHELVRKYLLRNGDKFSPEETLMTPSISANGWSQDSSGVQQAIVSTSFIPPSNIEILTCACLIVGLIQLLMSITRLGVISLMFSDQLVSGFTTAVAIHVITSQVGSFFDISMPHLPEESLKVFRTWLYLFDKLFEGFNQYTAMLSLLSVLFLIFIKDVIEPRLKRRFRSLPCLPSELMLMAILIWASWYWDFANNYKIRIIGSVPTGLPAPYLPRLDLVPYVVQESITIALVSFAMNLSLAQVYAKRFKYKLNPNQELFALGSTNVISSFFSCLPCGSSLSRTAVQSNLNPKSQLCALFSCAIVVSIICFFAPVLHDLPKSTLSCIIVVALRGVLSQVRDLYENWRLSKLDALVWIVTFTSVICFGVTYGLVLGIAASLFMVFFRLLTPNHSILGYLPGTDIYVDSSAFLDCHEIEQVKIFRFNSALCYLNRTMFKTSIEKSLPSIFRPRGFDLINAWRTRNSGVATLVEIIDDMADHELTVFLAACPMKLIDMLEKMKLTRIIEQNVYPSISDAVGRTNYLRSRTSGDTKLMIDLKQIVDSDVPINFSPAQPISERQYQKS